MNTNANLMEEVATQIIGGTMINVDVNVKNIMYVKKIMFRIMLQMGMDFHVCENGKYLATIMDDSATIV